MNKLALKIEETRFIDEDNEKIVSVYIDDENLIEIVKKYETKFDTEYPGSYSGDIPKFFVQSMQFDYANNMPILISPTLDSDDWPLLMNYDTRDNKVIWYDFHQPWRDKNSRSGFWDYSDFPKFTFDKITYHEELQKIYDYCYQTEGKEFVDFLVKTRVAFDNAGFLR